MSDDEGGRKFFIWNKFSLSYSMRASHFPAHEDYIMTNKLTKAGEQFMVGEDATMVVTDQENRITKTETDFILVEQTPEPNKVLGFDNSAQLKQINLSAQGEEFLRAILPGNSFVIVDNEGRISVVSMESGSGNLPITGGKLLGQLTVESGSPQITIKRKVAEDHVAIYGQDENGELLWRLIHYNDGNLVLINMISGSQIILDAEGQVKLNSVNGNELRLDTGDTTHVGGLTVEGDAAINYLTRTGPFYCDVTASQFQGTTEQIYGDRLTGANFEFKYYVERLETGHVQLVFAVAKDGVKKFFRFSADGDIYVERDIKATHWVYAGSAYMDTNGNIFGTQWGSNLNTYILTNFVQAVQYSAQRRIGLSNEDEIYAASGEVMSGIDNWKSGTTGFEGFYVKMTQVKVNNVWVNITG